MKQVTNIKRYCGIDICSYLCLQFTRRIMRDKAKGRIFIAWLLLVTLMPIFMVKTLHHHGEDDTTCHPQGGHSHSSSSHQCPICDFMLSPFIQAEAFQLHIVLPVFDFRPEIRIDKVCRAKSYPYHLRAPPAC